MNITIESIKNKIEKRIFEKSDAYFYLSSNITIDEIRELIKKVSELNINGIRPCARLYSPTVLQVSWCFMPRRTIMEYLNNLDPIMDPEIFLDTYFKYINR